MAESRTMAGLQRVDSKIMEAFKRAQGSMKSYQPTWRLCLAFLDNHQYAEINASTAKITELEVAEGGDKPRWLQRPVRNRFTSGLLRECALLSSRAPAPECTPRNGDPKRGWAAKMAEEVLLFLYEHLGLDLVYLGRLVIAGTCGGAYLWPYWKTDAGAYVGASEEGRGLYAGEIAFIKLQPDEVMWDPGYEFKDAPVHYVERAYAVDQVMNRDGYIGPAELKPDAVGSDYELGSPAAGESKNSVFVIDMLERPCHDYPKGRWISFLRGGEIVVGRRDYPRDAKASMGKPCLHELAWFRRDHRHRPLGGGELAIDIQKTRNRTIAQIGMWKNMVLNPRLLAPYGSLIEDPQGRPGEIIEYRPVAGQTPQWERPTEIPQSLFQTIDQCDRDMEELFGSWDMPDTESAQHMATAIERDRERRALQSKEIARFYADVSEHLLELSRLHWTEERAMIFEGRFAVSRYEAFKADVLPPMSVRITPGSIEARTRAAQAAMAWQLFEAGVAPIHQVMAAINSGTAQKLIDGFELQIAKQYREIETIIELAEGDASDLPDMDEITTNIVATQGLDVGQAAQTAMEVLQGALLEMGPQVGEEDDHAIHIDVLSQWMVTRDFELQPEVVQGIARAHLAAHKQVEAIDLQQQAIVQTEQAEEIGADNATRPAGQKPEPSRASMASQKEGMQ